MSASSFAQLGLQCFWGGRITEVIAMQAAALMIIYVLTAVVIQGIGFLISELVVVQWPAAGLMTFLILFIAAYGIAWPIAVRITEWGIRRMGYVVETEQSGGAGRLGVVRPKAKT